MKYIAVAGSLLLFAAPLSAQTMIPPGTVLPVQLESSVDARDIPGGTPLVARIAQDVPLPNGNRLKAGTRVNGAVVSATPPGAGAPASLALRFDSIQSGENTIPIASNLRALASPLEVDQAGRENSDSEVGEHSAAALTTTQIGGDLVDRESGQVSRADQKVGRSVFAGDWGELAVLASPADSDCHDSGAESAQPQALWVFSHDACGVYGYDATIRRANGGGFSLVSRQGDLKLRAGSALLLKVEEAGQSAAR